mgnify:CR=1 FL=1
MANEPERLIGNGADDPDAMNATLAKCDIEITAPHRSNCIYKTQDGRSLQRYKWQWKIERLNSRLLSYHQVAVCYEREVANDVGFVHLACVRILLRRYFWDEF